MDKEKKRKVLTIRNIIIGILLLVMVVSGIGYIREQAAARQQKEQEESLAQLASQTSEKTERESESITQAQEPETEAPYVSPIDFGALQAENPDTVGWIRIPDTRIDYPIVQAADNEKYLHTDFEGKDSIYGTVYLDCDSRPDFSGWNNPVYGHHMKDGSMFKDVVKFKEEEFFKEHQYFEIYTPERTIHLKAVACYYADSNGIVRKTRFASRESFDKWLDERLAPCSFAEIPEVPVDSMFVLVTCSYELNDARTLLYAVEVDEDGKVVEGTDKNVPPLVPVQDGQGLPMPSQSSAPAAPQA